MQLSKEKGKRARAPRPGPGPPRSPEPSPRGAEKPGGACAGVRAVWGRALRRNLKKGLKIASVHI